MFSEGFALERIRKIADYQFGRGIGEKLFPDDVEIIFSKRTRKIKYVKLNGVLLATLNPLNGLFALTVEGSRRILAAMKPKRLWVQVRDDATLFVEKGSDVFVKHVTDLDEEIRPGEEVIVVNSKGEVIAVGRAMLSGAEMRVFNRGIAVRVRRGRNEK